MNGVTTNFTTIGGKITSQNNGTDSLYFRYDKDDSLIGVQVNGAEYLYIKNLQGYIISIVDYDGNVVVNYTYDSFGKVVSITGSLADTIGQLNPMRYRGYYYDSETGFYYLQSRYYDSETQRFINADDTSVLQLSKEEAIGSNLFAYCGNNPVINSDPSGYMTIAQNANWLVASLFSAIGSLQLCGAALAAKVGTMILVIAPYLFWVVVVIAAVVLTYYTIQYITIQQVKKSISNKILTGDGKVDMKKFSKKPGSGPPRWVGPLGYELVKDLTEHKGPAYKLFKLGVRIATLALDGRILGK